MLPKTPLVRPEPYFRRWHGFSLGRPLAVVLGFWLTFVVALYALTSLFVSRLPDAPPRARSVMTDAVLGQALPMLVVALFAWALTALGLYLLARWVGGDGSYARTLAVAGWGMAPNAVGVLAATLHGYVLVGGAEFPADPRLAAEQFGAVLGVDGPVGALVSLGVTAWQWHVWRGGLRVGHDLDAQPAAVAAGVVAALSFLLSLL